MSKWRSVGKGLRVPGPSPLQKEGMVPAGWSPALGAPTHTCSRSGAAQAQAGPVKLLSGVACGEHVCAGKLGLISRAEGAGLQMASAQHTGPCVDELSPTGCAANTWLRGTPVVLVTPSLLPPPTGQGPPGPQPGSGLAVRWGLLWAADWAHVKPPSRVTSSPGLGPDQAQQLSPGYRPPSPWWGQEHLPRGGAGQVAAQEVRML